MAAPPVLRIDTAASAAAGPPPIENDEVRAAYAFVRAEGGPQRWLVLENKRTGMCLKASGEGGLDVLRAQFEGNDTQILFGYTRLTEPHQHTPVYVVLSFMHPRASSIQKARRSVAVQLITSLFENAAVYTFSDLAELSEELVLQKTAQKATSPSLQNRSSFLRTLRSLRSNGVLIDPSTPVFATRPAVSQYDGQEASRSSEQLDAPAQPTRDESTPTNTVPPVIAERDDDCDDDKGSAPRPPAPATPADDAEGLLSPDSEPHTPSTTLDARHDSEGKSPRKRTIKAKAKDKERAKAERDKDAAEKEAAAASASAASASAAPVIVVASPAPNEPEPATPTTATASPMDDGDASKKKFKGSGTKKAKTSPRPSDDKIITTITTEIKMLNVEEAPAEPKPKLNRVASKKTGKSKSGTGRKTSVSGEDAPESAQASASTPAEGEAPLTIKIDYAEETGAHASSAAAPPSSSGSEKSDAPPPDKRKSAINSALGRKDSAKRKANSLTQFDAIKFKGSRSDPALIAEADRAYDALSAAHRKEVSEDPGLSHTRGLSVASSEEGETYVAKVDHLASTLDELMFLKGELIYVIDKSSDIEWRGICSGVEGKLDPNDVMPWTGTSESIASSSPAPSEPEDDDHDKRSTSTKDSTSNALNDYEDMTIESAIEWLDDAGFPQYADKFEDGELVDENFIVQSHELLSSVQLQALLRRVRFLNLSLENEFLALQGGKIPSAGPETADDEQPTHTRKSNPFRLPAIRKMFSASTESDKDAKLKEFRDRMKRSPSKRRVRQKMISELSQEELVHAEKLALLQFTGMVEQRGSRLRDNWKWTIDTLKKTISAEKPKATDSKAVFGVELSDTVAKRGVRTTWSHGFIPLFLKNLIEFLSREGINTEGIFRVPGNAKRIEQLREQCDKTGGPLDLHGEKVHDVAGLLKKYLAELPDPLFTSDLYRNYAAVDKLPGKKEQLQALQLLSIMLPVAHRDLAAVMLKFMALISNNNAINKMTPDNVAICLGPALFRDARDKPSLITDSKRAMEKEAERQRAIRKVLTLMIENQSLLWQVPLELQEQLEDASLSKPPAMRSNTMSFPRSTSGSVVP